MGQVLLVQSKHVLLLSLVDNNSCVVPLSRPAQGVVPLSLQSFPTRSCSSSDNYRAPISLCLVSDNSDNIPRLVSRCVSDVSSLFRTEICSLPPGGGVAYITTPAQNNEQGGDATGRPQCHQRRRRPILLDTNVRDKGTRPSGIW